MQVDVVIGGVVVDGALRLTARTGQPPGVDAFGWQAQRLRVEPAPGRAEVTDDQGRRLFWAADPGSLAGLSRDGSATPADAVLLDWPGPVGAELGHLVARLRAAGVVTGRTELAVVLSGSPSSHGVPSRRLAAWGLRVVRAGDRLRLDGTRWLPRPAGRRPAGAARYRDPSDPAGYGDPSDPVGYRDPSDPGGSADTVSAGGGRNPRTLVLGPSASGKSQVAEDLLAAEPVVRYLATGPAPDPADPEWAARVAAHQARRPPWWHTEQTTDLAQALLHAGAPMLVDAIGTWVAAVMDRAGCWQDAESRPAGAWERVRREVDAVVRAWSSAAAPVVAVSEEVGWSVVPATAAGRAFTDVLGGLNQSLAAASDRVLLVVSGRVVDITGETW